jgi:hypothetical protein
MNPKLKTLFFFLIGAFAGILTMYLISNYKIEKRNQYAQETTHIDNYNESGKEDSDSPKKPEKKYQNQSNDNSIEELTDDDKVIAYVKSNHKLPDFYITKSEAKSQGWNPSKGNLCDVLPEKQLVEINSVIVKNNCQKVNNITKQMLIIIAETEAQTELSLLKMAMFGSRKIIINRLRNNKNEKQ